MKHLKKISFIFLIGLLAISCESVNESQVVADEFYAALDIEDFTTMVGLLDGELVDNEKKEEFLQIFKQHANVYGKIKSHSKYAFDTKTNNGQTIVKLKFKVECENGTAYESLGFIGRSDGYKIFAYAFNPEKSKIDTE